MNHPPLKYVFNLMLVSVFLSLTAVAEEAVSASTVKVSSYITAEGAYVNIPLPGKTTTAAFFTLHNKSARDIALVGVASEVSERVEIHSHSHKDGVMRMRKEEQVMIPAGTRVAFESGGWHLMLFDVTRTLQTSDQLHLTLMFSDGTSLPVSAQVRSLFDKPHH